MKRPSKSTQVIEPKARAIIFGHGRGWVFTPRDLARLGDPRSVGMALTRLSRKGVIRQLARGLYYYPIVHPTLGRVAATAGRKSGTVIQALRHLGQRHVDDKALAILRRQLNDADMAQLLKDLRYAPAWVADTLRRLAANAP